MLEKKKLFETLPLVGILFFTVLIGVELGGRGKEELATWPRYEAVYQQHVAQVYRVRVSGRESRVGSAFAWTSSRLVTAAHLVEGATRIWVDSGQEAIALEVVGVDLDRDIALLSSTGTPFNPVKLGDSSEVRVGQTVVAIGSPYGLGASLSVGVVGGLGQRLEAMGGAGFLQLGLSVNPGSSGGPLFNEGGEVVGLLVGMHAMGQGIGFALPVDELLRSVRAIELGRRSDRAFVGLEVERRLGALWVVSVRPMSPASDAGLLPGDRLLRLNQARVTATTNYKIFLASVAPGERLRVRYLRGAVEGEAMMTAANRADVQIIVAGMQLAFSAGSGGEVIAVRPRSRAARTGVRTGDRLRSVNGAPVFAPAEVRDRVRTGLDWLEVVREERLISLYVRVQD